MKRLGRWRFPFAVACVLAVQPGCAPVDSGGTGFVRVLVADEPGDVPDDVALRVTLRDVYLIPEDANRTESAGIRMRGGPIAIPGDLEIQLRDLRGGRTVLVASEQVPAGDYARVRLVFASAAVIRRGVAPGDPVSVTSVGLEGRRVDVPLPFALRAGEIHEVMLDFDAAASARTLEAGGTGEIVVRPTASSLAERVP